MRTELEMPTESKLTTERIVTTTRQVEEDCKRHNLGDIDPKDFLEMVRDQLAIEQDIPFVENGGQRPIPDPDDPRVQQLEKQLTTTISQELASLFQL